MIQKNPYDNWGKEAYIDKDDLLFYVKFFALCLAREKTKGSLIS